MKIKSYFASAVTSAIAMARAELGPEAMLVTSRPAPAAARHLGEFEVVFALTQDTPVAAAPAAAPGYDANPAGGERFGREMAELKQQLDSMRRALNQSAFTPAEWLGKSAGLSEAYSLLTANEVLPQLALEIVQAAAGHCSKTSGEPHCLDPNSYGAVADEIQSRIPIEAALGAGDALPRIAALVGPPGAGKTTTLVKLAVNYGLAARRPVLLLSTDTYRVGAADQLRSYAGILGMGFQLLETVSSLAQAIEENRGKELILIDTPGLALADLESTAPLARFLAGRKDIDRQLVLSSSTKPADLTRVIDAYQIFRPGRLLFTKLDETNSLGPIFNEAVRTRKPLSFFTNGQRIPEDLETASHHKLIEAILGGRPTAAVSAA